MLLLYHRPALLRLIGDASNVNENIAAFGRHSRFPVYPINTALGFPEGLARLEFDAILLHYSLFRHGVDPYHLQGGFFEYLGEASGYKLATFQDEHHWCGKRFAFLNEYGIDCVFTLFEPRYFAETYGRYAPGVSRLVYQLPGYVGPELEEAGRRFSKPETERSIDVGYRGRTMAAYMGRGAIEKFDVGERFAARAKGRDIRLDIDVLEESRLYGDQWPQFIANCRAVLGSESGASCSDLEDEVRTAYERLGAELGREPTIEEMEAEGTLPRWDWKVPYRMASPRHFEAAALGVCQILYEGAYSGVMEPMRHYIPLKKDFSNFDEVLERFRDDEVRRELTENSRRDLIESGTYSYRRIVAEEFDPVLADAGLNAQVGLQRAVSSEVRTGPIHRARIRGPLFWEWLWGNHPVVFRALWLAGRPFAYARRGWRLLGSGSGR